MSLDLVISSRPCKECGHKNDTEYFNYTYNAARMWYELFPDDDDEMVQIEGMTGSEARIKIDTAIKEMVKHEYILKQFEPENGGGSYHGFLSFLIEVGQACARHPKDIWRADR